ncbi:MAG: hypothetical protein HYY84_20060 [Deltaproteobacteria bacterium]|nr:hypothetical protein [Deltaproteobacteria bacterium]
MNKRYFTACFLGILAAPTAFAQDESASTTPPSAPEETTTAAPADTKPPAETAKPTEVVAAEKKKVLVKPKLRPVSAARIRAGAFDHRKTGGFVRSSARSLEAARRAYFDALSGVTRCAPRRSAQLSPRATTVAPPVARGNRVDRPAAPGQQRPSMGQRPASGERPTEVRRPVLGRRPAVQPSRTGAGRARIVGGNYGRETMVRASCGAQQRGAARADVGRLRMAYIRAKERFAGHGLSHRAALAHRIAKGAAVRHVRGKLAGLASPIYGEMAAKLRTPVRNAIKGIDLVELTKGNVKNGRLDQAAATKVVSEKVLAAVKGDIDAVIAAAAKRLEEVKAHATTATKSTVAQTQEIQTKEVAAAATEVAATEAKETVAKASTEFTDRLRKRAESYVVSVCRAVVRATALRLAKAGTAAPTAKAAPAAATPDATATAPAATTSEATTTAKEEVKKEAEKASEAATKTAEIEVKAEAKKEEAAQKTEEKAAEKTETEAKTEATAAATEEKTQEKAEEKAAEKTESDAKTEEAKPEEKPAEEAKPDEAKPEESSGGSEEKKD